LLFAVEDVLAVNLLGDANMIATATRDDGR